MNNVKKIGIVLLVLGVMTGFTQAATHHHESQPDATLRLSTGGFAHDRQLRRCANLAASAIAGHYDHD